MSWSGTTTPIKVTGHKATATCEVDSTVVGDEAFQAVYDAVYGSANSEPTFLTPEQVAAIVTEHSASNNAQG